VKVSSKLLSQIRKKIVDVEKAYALPDKCEIKKTYLVHSSGKIMFVKVFSIRVRYALF